MDSNGGCTTVWMYILNTIEFYIQKWSTVDSYLYFTIVFKNCFYHFFFFYFFMRLLKTLTLHRWLISLSDSTTIVLYLWIQRSKFRISLSLFTWHIEEILVYCHGPESDFSLFCSLTFEKVKGQHFT